MGNPKNRFGVFHSPRATGRILPLRPAFHICVSHGSLPIRRGGLAERRRGRTGRRDPDPGQIVGTHREISMFETRGFSIVGFYCVWNRYCDRGQHLKSVAKAWEEAIGRDGHGRAKAMGAVGHSHAPRDDPVPVARALALNITALVGTIM